MNIFLITVSQNKPDLVILGEDFTKTVSIDVAYM